MFSLSKRIHVLKLLSSFLVTRKNMTDLCTSTAGNSENSQNLVQRLVSVEGYGGQKNDIIYHPRNSDKIAKGTVIFFGGDVQDYPESMLSHRDNKHHIQWNLERTAMILHSKFPSYEIFIVRPSRMHLKTFSCYENFVPGNDCGVPCHDASPKALTHLQCLLSNARQLMNKKFNSELTENHCQENDSILIIGFSKGCVVLNQLLYSFTATELEELNLSLFAQRIKAMYWLDGGHSGGSNTWIVDKSVLQHFSKLGIDVYIQVTPYQIRCESRPWIGKEERSFSKTLKRFGVKVTRQVHFDEEPRSLENHFKILENFII